MNTRLTICLGKLGDIISLLPVWKHDYDNGVMHRVLVSEKYADVLSGVSYVEPIVFDGDENDLERAVNETRATGQEFTVAQVVGPPEPVLAHAYTNALPAGSPAKAITDSHTKELWRLMGQWGLWRKNPPLVFDKRNPDREAALVAEHTSPKKKVILVSLGGKSSPFPYRDLLLKLLKSEFKAKHQVVVLDDIKAPYFYDLLGLYERADVLIAADSAPLHLSAAVPRLPTVALIQDKPSLWHGSPWRPNHLMHIRYSDFSDRAVDMLEKIANIGGYGCRFFKGRTEVIRHAWSRYDVSPDNLDRCQKAWDTWRRLYLKNWSFMSCEAEVGAFGKDTRNSELRDAGRYPSLKDVISLATMGAGDEELIVLTRADTCFEESYVPKNLTYSHREVRGEKGTTWHPAVDLMVFTKAWWDSVSKQVPDLILGPDSQWSRVMMEMIKGSGGTEVEGAVYRYE